MVGGRYVKHGLRLSKYFGTSTDFWMNLQIRWELYHAQAAEADVLGRIPSYKARGRDKVTG